ISKRSVMLSDLEINTGVMVDQALADGTGIAQSSIDEIHQTLYAGRDAVITDSSQLGLVHFIANFIPPTPRALDELDQMVIATDRLLGDTAGLAKLRNWLHEGGRLWIMLDQTSEELVSELLGSEIGYSVIDRVELNDYQLETPATSVELALAEAWESEIPVEMVRVVTDVDQVAVSVQGWPAAFWQRFGQGEVLFTTLAARGWRQSDDQPTAALRRLSTLFFEPREEVQPASQPLRPILNQQIGYRIPSRGVAAGILGVNVLLILAAGVWLARQRRLERMAVLLPVSALLTTGLLLAIGNRQTASVPSTVATGQIIRVVDGVDQVQVSTIRAIYSQQSGDVQLSAAYRTMTVPARVEGTTRIRWDDSGRSTWVGTPYPPGAVRYAESESNVSLNHPLVVRGTFGKEGFVGTVQGVDPATCEDGLIISLPAPSTAATLGAAGEPAGVIANTSDLLAAQQFIPGALLTDRQRARQLLLREMLRSPQQHPFGDGPSLLVWSQPMSLGVEFASRFERSGSALMSIPVRVDRPTAEDEFRIPATFVGIDAHVGSRGVSSVFNPRTGKWLPELTKPTEAELVGRFPQALMPFSLRKVNVTVKMNAPSRSLVVKSMVDGKPQEVFRRSDPGGVIQFTVDRPEALQLDQQGGWWFSVGVTASRDEQEAAALADPEQEPTPTSQDAGSSTWQIDYIHVDAVGTIAPQQPVEKGV
ncbi:MAG: hypothetical protein MI861_00265, partial [Pirellulales bacterium]|nr:hypothetical protein [Pirellulales bacterium]